MFVLFGWIGTIIYLLNHAYISFKKNWEMRFYYGGNLIAAIVLVISSYVVDSHQAVFINSFWALVSIGILAKWPIDKIPVNARVFYVGLGLFFGVSVYKFIIHDSLNLTLIGWSAAYVFTFGYLLFCCNKLNHTPYLLLNAYAAIVLMPQLWIDENWPVFVLEIAWAGISLIGAVKSVSEPHLMD